MFTPIIFAAIPTQPASFAFNVSSKSCTTDISFFVAGTAFFLRNKTSLIIGRIINYPPIKFLLFCSFAPDEIRSLCEKNEDFPQKPMFFLFSHIFISSVISNNLYLSPLEINFPESYILLVHSTLPNCRFKIARKKKKHHIPDAASERV